MTATESSIGRWTAPANNVELGLDEVHVWRIELNRPSPQIEDLFQKLAPYEQERANRFHFLRDRDRFIIAHGALRTILGSYLNQEAHQLRFSYNPYGKPYLTDSGCLGDLRFNLSHSQGLALVAVARERDVGIDIECIRPERADGEIVDRFFSASEVAILRSLPSDVRLQGFFSCWTRKEAYIKARGEGLSFPPQSFDVSLAPGECRALVANRIDPEEVSRWSLKELFPGAGFAAAIVVEMQRWRLKCWQWSG
jgi:4'-phosphopantetheinyl transferase